MPVTRRHHGKRFIALAAVALTIPVGSVHADVVDSPRLRLTVQTNGQQAEATRGSYHCVPTTSGSSVCIDGRYPIEVRKTVTARPRGVVRLRTYARTQSIAVFAASGKRGDTSAANSRPLKHLADARRKGAGRRRWTFELPSRLPRGTRRLRFVVTHHDGNHGDFEVGVRLRRVGAAALSNAAHGTSWRPT